MGAGGRRHGQSSSVDLADRNRHVEGTRTRERTTEARRHCLRTRLEGPELGGAEGRNARLLRPCSARPRGRRWTRRSAGGGMAKGDRKRRTGGRGAAGRVAMGGRRRLTI